MYCEDIPVSAIADAVGTPFYLYSHSTLVRHYRAFHNAFHGLDRMVCYSAKANTSHAVLKTLSGLGAGLDIVSGGELFRGLQAGFDPKRIVYSGVGKRMDEIDYALNTGILMFNIESPEELEVIHARARALNATATIGIRVNPDVDPQTHPYISTGLRKNKFGIDTQSAVETYRKAREMKHIRVAGIDCHIGSQITHVKPFEDALQNLLELIDHLETSGVSIEYLDMGGGLGISYGEETPPHPTEYASAITRVLGNRKIRLIFEPGRVIVGNAGILVTRVLYRKSGSAKEFVITDAAMNDLMRPILYDAYHEILPVTEAISSGDVLADVVGPICESGDFLAQGRRIPEVRRSDLLAVMSAGAYGFSMSSNYCSRLRVAEVMVKGSEYAVIRERETLSDLIRGESAPSFL
jgi:diaminopimelate decarboxylase